MARTRVKAKLKNGVTTVRMLITHKMDVEHKDKKTGKQISAHFITHIGCQLNGKQVLDTWWSQAISKNPYLSFKLNNASKGDTLSVKWTDSKGETESSDFKVR